MGTPLDANVKLLLHCDGANNGTTFTDSSANNYSCTAKGNGKTSTTSPKFGSAAYLGDGTTDGVACGVASDWSFLHYGTSGSPLWTVDLWVKPAAFTGLRALFSTLNDGGGTYKGVYAYIQNTTRKIGFTMVKATGVTGVICSGEFATAYPNDTSNWHHVAITYDHSLANQNAVLYIDGNASGTLNKTAYAPASGDPGGPLTMGAFVDVAPSPLPYSLNGGIDEFRVSDVKRYTGAFTVETEAYGLSGGFMTTNKGYW